MRVICILGVIYIHVIGYQSGNIFTNHVYIGHIIDFLTSASVPLFFMISGALLLDRTEDIQNVFSKRILRFSIVLISISVIQWLIAYSFDESISIKSVFFGIIGAKSIPHVNFWALWFLYVYIIVLIFLPFLQHLAKALPNSAYIYLIILHFIIACCIPSIHNIAGNGNSDIFLYKITPFYKAESFPCTPIYASFYLLLGYYSEHRLRYSKKPIVILAVLSSIILVSYPILKQFSYSYEFVSIPCIFIYATTKYLWKKWNIQNEKLWLTLGGAAFSVMLTENIFRLFAQPHIEKLIPCDNKFLSLSIVVILTWITCLTIGVALKRIPIVNRFI